MKELNVKEILESNILVIEPHFDDAIYSMGGTISKFNIMNKKFTILTVFSKYRELNENRYLEQLSAFQDIEHDSEQLEYKDALCRNNNIILGKHMYKEIKQKIQQLILEKRISMIFYPMACGGHTDHVIVNQICKSLCVKHKLEYEDLPYAYEYSEDIYKEYVICETDIDKKIQRCREYKTQITSETIDKIFEYAHRIGKNLNSGDCAERFRVC